MKSTEIVMAVIQLVIIALEIYFIYWTVKNIRKMQEKQEIMWQEIQQLKRDGIDDYQKNEKLKNRIEKLEKEINNKSDL